MKELTILSLDFVTIFAAFQSEVQKHLYPTLLLKKQLTGA